MRHLYVFIQLNFCNIYLFFVFIVISLYYNELVKNRLLIIRTEPSTSLIRLWKRALGGMGLYFLNEFWAAMPIELDIPVYGQFGLQKCQPCETKSQIFAF